MVKIVIQSTETPSIGNPEVMIRWFCMEFGLSGSEEENSISEQILKVLALAAQQNKGLTSSELGISLNKVIVDKPLARSTVIYHLNGLMEVGLVVKRGRTYHLRATEMVKAIEEIQYDMEREMSKMLNTAREFDKLMSGMFGMPPAQEGNRQIRKNKEG